MPLPRVPDELQETAVDAENAPPFALGPRLEDANAEAAAGRVDEALAIYAAVRAHYPVHPAAYQRAAQLLVTAGRSADAEALLRTGISRIPDEASLAVDFARLAMFARAWPETLERWTVFQARFPGIPAGFAGAAMALRELGRVEEAGAVVRGGVERFPEDADVLTEGAILAEQTGALDDAAALWERVRRHAPNRPPGYLVGSRLAERLGRLDEAEALASEAAYRFPDQAPVWMRRAELASGQARWGKAIEYWAMVEALVPNNPAGVRGHAVALRQARRLDEAEAVIKTAMGRFPDEPSIWEEYALVARAREDWRETLQRFSNAQRRFPSLNIFRQRLFETRLQIGETALPDSEEPAEVAGSTAPSEATRALVMQFESLGGTGHGCEFGIFQRHFGGEPLGLLRWADLLFEQLLEALDSEFEGVGSPEQTILFVLDHHSRPEYWTRDRRFHMAMRSFVFPDEVPQDRMFQQVTRRLQFLRRKLIDDLRVGEKIFVYRNMMRNLTPVELERLHSAVRRYGDNRLLYIQYAGDAHTPGTVEMREGGLLLGFVERFSNDPVTDAYLGPSVEGLRQVCEAAAGLCSMTAAEAATSNSGEP